jgi:hypothetical protein
MKQRQIFAIGGRFYVDTCEPPLLQRHLLSLSSARSPRICLLAGAVGDNPTATEQFYREIGIHNCRPRTLTSTNPLPATLPTTSRPWTSSTSTAAPLETLSRSGATGALTKRCAGN